MVSASSKMSSYGSYFFLNTTRGFQSAMGIGRLGSFGAYFALSFATLHIRLVGCVLELHNRVEAFDDSISIVRCHQVVHFITHPTTLGL